MENPCVLQDFGDNNVEIIKKQSHAMDEGQRFLLVLTNSYISYLSVLFYSEYVFLFL